MLIKWASGWLVLRLLCNCQTWLYTCIVDAGTILPAMETKDIRQRFVGSAHQKYSYQGDGSLQDDEKRRSRPSQCVPYLWKNLTIVNICLFAVVFLIFWLVVYFVISVSIWCVFVAVRGAELFLLQHLSLYWLSFYIWMYLLTRAHFQLHSGMSSLDGIVKYGIRPLLVLTLFTGKSTKLLWSNCTCLNPTTDPIPNPQL